MTLSLADRSMKTSGVKLLSLVGKDPEAHRGELIKASAQWQIHKGANFQSFFFQCSKKKNGGENRKTG